MSKKLVFTEPVSGSTYVTVRAHCFTEALSVVSSIIMEKKHPGVLSLVYNISEKVGLNAFFTVFVVLSFFKHNFSAIFESGKIFCHRGTSVSITVKGRLLEAIKAASLSSALLAAAASGVGLF